MWERTKLKARKRHLRQFLHSLKGRYEKSLHRHLKGAGKKGFGAGWNAALDFYIRSKESVPSNECIPLDILDLK